MGSCYSIHIMRIHHKTCILCWENNSTNNIYVTCNICKAIIHKKCLLKYHKQNIYKQNSYKKKIYKKNICPQCKNNI